MISVIDFWLFGNADESTARILLDKVDRATARIFLDKVDRDTARILLDKVDGSTAKVLLDTVDGATARILLDTVDEATARISEPLSRMHNAQNFVHCQNFRAAVTNAQRSELCCKIRSLKVLSSSLG